MFSTAAVDPTTALLMLARSKMTFTAIIQDIEVENGDNCVDSSYGHARFLVVVRLSSFQHISWNR
jgi:hypothetical protein